MSLLVKTSDLRCGSNLLALPICGNSSHVISDLLVSVYFQFYLK